MKRILIAPLILGVSFSASAQITSEECSPCSIAETRQLAIDQGTGDHFFFDMINRRLTHWAINQNAGRTTITNVPLTSGQQKIYAATQNFYDTVGSLTAYGTQPISTKLPAGLTSFSRQSAHGTMTPMGLNGKVTAFDVVESPATKQAAINDLTSFSFGGFVNVVRIGVAVVINAFTNNVIINAPIHIYSRAILSDGSSFVAKYNFQAGQYEYVQNSAKDAVGNSIPEDSVMAAGGPNSMQKYIFPSTPQGQMSGIAQVQHLNNLGIGVQVVTRGGTWMIACVNSFGRTTCNATLVP